MQSSTLPCMFVGKCRQVLESPKFFPLPARCAYRLTSPTTFQFAHSAINHRIVTIYPRITELCTATRQFAKAHKKAVVYVCTDFKRVQETCYRCIWQALSHRPAKWEVSCEWFLFEALGVQNKKGMLQNLRVFLKVCWNLPLSGTKRNQKLFSGEPIDD
jgi:hypothetical protein